VLKYVIGAAVAAGFATPALAQEGAPFTGPRIEAIVGWDNADVDGDSADGAVYGAAIGYDFQLGGAVVGIEGEINDSTAKDCVDDVLVTGDEFCVKAGRDLYAGARVGAIVGEATLLYAKAGYTNGRASVVYTDEVGEKTSEGTNLDGIRGGAGIEHLVGTNFYLKAEYRYSNYEADVERHQVVAGVGFRF
jgi:outer membrane immunogenic protein